MKESGKMTIKVQNDCCSGKCMKQLLCIMKFVKIASNQLLKCFFIPQVVSNDFL